MFYELEENGHRSIFHSKPVMFAQNKGINQTVYICGSKLLMNFQVSPRSQKVCIGITNITEKLLELLPWEHSIPVSCAEKILSCTFPPAMKARYNLCVKLPFFFFCRIKTNKQKKQQKIGVLKVLKSGFWKILYCEYILAHCQPIITLKPWCA